MKRGVSEKIKTVAVSSLSTQDRLWLSYRCLALHEICPCSHGESHFELHLKEEEKPFRTTRPPGWEHPQDKQHFRVTSTCCKKCRKCGLPVRMVSHEVHEKTCTLQVDTRILFTFSRTM